MKFSKYSAIYRNDDIIINDEEVIGSVKDVKEYLRYELANQCMSEIGKYDYENFIDNGRLILDFIERLELNDENDDNKIIVKLHPMGSLYYEDYIEDDTEYKMSVQNLYDEYLMTTENRNISYGELHHIQNLSKKELEEFENEILEKTRRCSECGKLMIKGYCIENGLEYYCSDECLHKNISEEEYNELYDNGNGDSYWTEWECV